MTDKDVKKLSKEQLIEILYYLSQDNDKLREENERLKSRLDVIVHKLIDERAESGRFAIFSEEDDTKTDAPV